MNIFIIRHFDVSRGKAEMFEPYSLTTENGRRTVVFHFRWMKILFLVIGVPSFIMSLGILFAPMPQTLVGVWWVVILTLLFFLFIPPRYTISSGGNFLKVDNVGSFWRRKNRRVPFSLDPRIQGNSVGLFRPSPGGFRIELTGRKYRPSLTYVKGGKTRNISFFPTASYFMTGNYTQVREKQLREIADHLGIDTVIE